jgi:hypothetical protein
LDAVRFDRAAEQLAGSEDVRLTRVFVEIARPHAGCQRSAPQIGLGGHCGSGCFRRGTGNKKVVSSHSGQCTLSVREFHKQKGQPAQDCGPASFAFAD